MTQLPTDPLPILQDLIRCASVTPADKGALATLERWLTPMGFASERPVFSDDGTADIENLYAKWTGDGPHLMFAGHTDVVPPGDEATWTHAPFSAAVDGSKLFGRGAVDMKGGIACFVAALARVIEHRGNLPGSVSLLITGDEEGPAINGTRKLLEWATTRGERWDGCLLGEPTNPDQMGDMIKIGRRGSLTGTLIVEGTQGHAAYPHHADNPVRGMIALAAGLLETPLDDGTEDFQPSNLEITTIDVGNQATNVIAAQASATFNVRFNDRWNGGTLKAEIERRLERAAEKTTLRPHNDAPLRYRLHWHPVVSDVFVTHDRALADTLLHIVEKATGRTPALSTSGGTSDARFIKDYCPVIEFGLVGKTMHMVDEHVALEDLEMLTSIYEMFITEWFDRQRHP